jgi:hypothetical protein
VSAVEVIAVQGGEQLLRAALLATGWILLAGAAFAAGCAAWGLLALRLLARREPCTLVITGPCRWCDDPDCIDSALCTCAVPCPAGYCQAADPAATIVMLCPCCNGARGGNCICTHDCGSPRCQAACPAHAEGCGPGANLLAYPSLACPACDQIAARLLEDGDCRG